LQQIFLANVQTYLSGLIVIRLAAGGSAWAFTDSVIATRLNSLQQFCFGFAVS
jgi:hypothetical protein